MVIAQWRVLVVRPCAPWPLGPCVHSVRPVLGRGAQEGLSLLFSLCPQVLQVRQIQLPPLVEMGGQVVDRATSRVAIAPHCDRATQGERPPKEAPSGHTVDTAVRTDSVVPRAVALKGLPGSCHRGRCLAQGQRPISVRAGARIFQKKHSNAKADSCFFFDAFSREGVPASGGSFMAFVSGITTPIPF